ncbi:hypothetical protein AB1Y20_009727 [Prymnesium parvum]|uniref:Uncharacterized protein n=1 Tax=Prymnesium parvum TaxID=97485 RepID=A0AB34K611_PRYPA
MPLRSLLGVQADSRKESAPSYGFGTSDRTSLQVVYGGGRPGAGDSRPTARATKLSPGPIYLPSRASDTGPKFSFGGQGLGVGSHPASRRAGAPPGPGDYDLAGAVGKQSVSQARTAPSFTWGAGPSSRDAVSVAAATGYPPKCEQLYDRGPSIGPQYDSTKRTKASYAFGTAQRFVHDQTVLRRSAAEPGPGAYNLRSADTTRASHVDSTSRSQPKYGFGTAKRFDDPETARVTRIQPGSPPSGQQLGGGIGRQIVSERRTKPSFGFGSQRRFGDSVLKVALTQTPGPGTYDG